MSLDDNSSSHDDKMDLSKLKLFAENKCISKHEIVFHREENIVEKGEMMVISIFS